MPLDTVEARVVGSLIEKQLTTPQQYPLTLNALTLACNQTSNRDPVVSYTEGEVQGALDRLKQQGLARFVLPSHGRSVVRYRHVLDEKLALDQRQLALLGVLLLRGPQTVGELRTRTERMATFTDLAEVESDLEGLTRGDDPLVSRLPRRPGQKEERWVQLLADEAVAGHAGRAEGPASASAPAAVPGSPAAAGGGLSDSVAALRSEVEQLRAEVAGLRSELEALRAALGGS